MLPKIIYHYKTSISTQQIPKTQARIDMVTSHVCDQGAWLVSACQPCRRPGRDWVTQIWICAVTRIVHSSQGLCSLSGRAYNRKISLSLETARFGFRHDIQSRDFETSRDLAVSRLTSHWKEDQATPSQFFTANLLIANGVWCCVEYFSLTHMSHKATRSVSYSGVKFCGIFLWRNCPKIEEQDDVIKWKQFNPRYWPLCGEFTGHRWIPLTNPSDAELWCFLWSTFN